MSDFFTAEVIRSSLTALCEENGYDPEAGA